MTRRLLLSVCVSLLCACAAPQSNPPIVAASNFLHPPFSYRDAGGAPVGIEIELLAEAARSLGREVEWVERPFGELLPEVASGRVDVAASTIGVTAERARIVSFSDSYFTTTIVALVRPGDGEPRSLDELSGKRVATERGTTTIAAVAARVPGAERVLDRTGDDTWAEMLSGGAIDAVVLDRSHAEKFKSDAVLARFHIIEEPLREEHFAFALHPDATELRTALDKVIAERPVL